MTGVQTCALPICFPVTIEGQGFTQKYLNTSFVGDIYKLKFNNYNYSNIIVDGKFKQPIFSGKVIANDPNLYMDFNGTVDLSAKENIYDFHSKIDYVNLDKLNFLKDSIAVFKGDIDLGVIHALMPFMARTISPGSEIFPQGIFA